MCEIKKILIEPDEEVKFVKKNKPIPEIEFLRSNPNTKPSKTTKEHDILADEAISKSTKEGILELREKLSILRNYNAIFLNGEKNNKKLFSVLKEFIFLQLRIAFSQNFLLSKVFINFHLHFPSK